MHSIRIDVSDTIYDKVMFFLQHLPKTDIKLYDKTKQQTTDKLSDFFKDAPLKDLSFDRGSEIYESRVNF